MTNTQQEEWERRICTCFKEWLSQTAHYTNCPVLYVSALLLQARKEARKEAYKEGWEEGKKLEYWKEPYQEVIKETREDALKEVIEILQSVKVHPDNMKHDLQCKCDFEKNKIIDDLLTKLKEL